MNRRLVGLVAGLLAFGSDVEIGGASPRTTLPGIYECTRATPSVEGTCLPIGEHVIENVQTFVDNLVGYVQGG